MPKGREFVLRDGSDTALHAPILAEGDAQAAEQVSRQRLRARGWSEQDIDEFLAPSN